MGKGVVCSAMVGIHHSQVPAMTNRGWMVKQVAVKLAICNAVCFFNKRIQGVIIRWEVDRTLFLNFLPLGSPCLPASSSCTFPKDAGLYKSLSYQLLYYPPSQCFHQFLPGVPLPWDQRSPSPLPFFFHGHRTLMFGHCLNPMERDDEL